MDLQWYLCGVVDFHDATRRVSQATGTHTQLNLDFFLYYFWYILIICVPFPHKLHQTEYQYFRSRDLYNFSTEDCHHSGNASSFLSPDVPASVLTGFDSDNLLG
jgi:hypothetical protein